LETIVSKRQKIILAMLGLAAIGGVVAIAAPGPHRWHGDASFHAVKGEGRFEGMWGGDMGPGGYGGFGHEGRRGWFGRGDVTQDEADARARERFARIDRNSDGVLDRAEIEAALAEARDGRRGRWLSERVQRGEQRWLRRFDADRDGKVTKAEFLAGMTARFAELDLDGDGRITDADLPPRLRGRGAIERLAAGEGPGPMRMLRGIAVVDGAITRDAFLAHAGLEFDRLDVLKSGVLDAANSDARRKAATDYQVRRFIHHFGGSATGTVTRDQFLAKARERFAAADLDGDGRITRSERGERPGWRERFERWRQGGPDRGQPDRGGPAAPPPPKQ
jgi:Ca2+-binding EF-hand superfamily protein